MARTAGTHSSLRVRGLNVRAHAVAPEKEKVSLTLDKPLVDEIRSSSEGERSRRRSMSFSTFLLRRGRLACPWPKDRRGHLVEDGLLIGSMSSVRYAGASAFDLAMNAAWASWSSGGGGSVRDSRVYHGDEELLCPAECTCIEAALARQKRSGSREVR